VVLARRGRFAWSARGQVVDIDPTIGQTPTALRRLLGPQESSRPARPRNRDFTA
jgi:hypothetical protein